MARSSRPLDEARPSRAGRGGGAVALAVALGAAGCDDELRIDVTYQVIERVAATDGACGAAPTAPPIADKAVRVRFTFRDHGAAGPGPLRCDVVVDRGGAAPVIAVPRRNEPVDVWVEYFTEAGAVIARGTRANVDLTSGDVVRIYAAGPDTFTCAPAQSLQPRAFHSATRMPGGEVLLIGGLIDPPGPDGDAGFPPSDGAYVTSSAELYDPVSDRVTAIGIPGLSPRAFHDVVVLGVAGDVVHMVIAGGVGVNGNAAATGNVAAISGPIGEAPWATVAADGGARAGSVPPPPELLRYTMSTRSVTRTPLTDVPSRFFTAGGVDDIAFGQPRVIAGGQGLGGDRADVLATTGTIDGTLTGVTRVGSTIVATTATTALWLGGALAGSRLFDELRELDGQSSLVPGPVPPPGTNRAFGAATRVGTDVLYVGGLAIDTAAGRITDATPAPPGHWIGLATIDPLATADLAPAAYLGAVQLPGGDVLVSGGAVANQVACRGTLACPSSQSVRINRAATAVVGPPGLPRYGHRLTRLADGTVLVSGGFTSVVDNPDQIRPVATLEQFEPHDADDDPLADLFADTPGLTRAPGEVAMRDGAAAATCTVVVAGAAVDAAAADAAPEVDALEIDATLR